MESGINEERLLRRSGRWKGSFWTFGNAGILGLSNILLTLTSLCKASLALMPLSVPLRNRLRASSPTSLSSLGTKKGLTRLFQGYRRELSLSLSLLAQKTLRLALGLEFSYDELRHSTGSEHVT